MAKEKELTQIKKGTAQFNLVGKAKVGDFTFKLDVESNKEDSDWIYNQMNLGVDCGESGVIYADMMGGYGSERENVVYVHGKKKKDNGKDTDDFDKSFTIDWDDRLDEDNFKEIGDLCFITVGLEKDEKGSTVYKKFLTQYDAIQYINDNLEEGTLVNVKGSLKYQIYNENISVKKEINSVVLSKATEDKFKATFTQTILVESDAIGKPDKETMTIPVTASVVDFVKEYQEQKIYRLVKGKKKEGMNLPLRKVFEIVIGEDKNKTTTFLKQFKAKSKKVTEVTVEGIFTKGSLNTEEVSESDIPEDIKELIELGVIDKDEILGKIAFANGGKKPEKMIITAPNVRIIEVNGNKIPSISREADKYNEDDLNPFLIIEQFGASEKIEDEKDEEEILENVDVDMLMEEQTEEDSESEEEDEDWLKDL
jgi:hypothetical protein